MALMTKKRWVIVLTVVVLALEATGLALSLPGVFGPDQSRPSVTSWVALGFIFMGLLLLPIVVLLRRERKASAEE